MGRIVLPLAFLALGGYLVSSAGSFPGGAAGTPGAGAFPRVIGVVMALLAAGLLIRNRQEDPPRGELNSILLSSVALLFVYLALWGTGFFAVRTAVFLILLLKVAGESWVRSAGVAVVLTAVVIGAFQFGLSVSLE